MSTQIPNKISYVTEAEENLINLYYVMAMTKLMLRLHFSTTIDTNFLDDKKIEAITNYTNNVSKISSEFAKDASPMLLELLESEIKILKDQKASEVRSFAISSIQAMEISDEILKRKLNIWTRLLDILNNKTNKKLSAELYDKVILALSSKEGIEKMSIHILQLERALEQVS